MANLKYEAEIPCTLTFRVEAASQEEADYKALVQLLTEVLTHKDAINAEVKATDAKERLQRYIDTPEVSMHETGLARKITWEDYEAATSERDELRAELAQAEADKAELLEGLTAKLPGLFETWLNTQGLHRLEAQRQGLNLRAFLEQQTDIAALVAKHTECAREREAELLMFYSGLLDEVENNPDGAFRFIAAGRELIAKHTEGK